MIEPERPKTPQPETPELEKRSALMWSGAPEAVSEFLDWLDGQGIHLARLEIVPGYRDRQLVPASDTMDREQMLERHFGLDSDLLEKERRALFEWLREKQS